MTGPEIERLDGASHFMAKPCPRSSQLFFASVHHATSRDIIADIQKRLTKLQNAANLPPYSAWVFENSGGLHAHLIFIGDRGGSIAGRLEGSAKFGALLHVGPVTDLRGLTRNYLVKERTPQAGWRRQNLLGGRIKGSHGLKGGGDRVRLSRELERDAIEAGYVEPWQHTNARRSVVRKAYSPRPRRDGAPLPGTQTTASVRASLFSDGDEHEHDVREHGDGHVVAADGGGLTPEDVRRLADEVRTAKSHLSRARSSAAELAQGEADLAKALDLVDAERGAGECEPRATVRTQLDSNGRPPPVKALATSAGVSFAQDRAGQALLGTSRGMWNLAGADCFRSCSKSGT